MGLTRKGFTLVELLIVVSILSTLSATLVMSMRGATATTKAAVIASNVEACKTAAALCVANTDYDKLATMGVDYVLAKYVPTWADFAYASNDMVTYTADGTGVDGWALKVDFTNDNEHEDIKAALQRIKGYNKYYDYYDN